MRGAGGHCRAGIIPCGMSRLAGCTCRIFRRRQPFVVPNGGGVLVYKLLASHEALDDRDHHVLRLLRRERSGNDIEVTRVLWAWPARPVTRSVSRME